jgi:hypothetical protein
LTSGNDQRQQLLALFDGQVQLGAQPAPGAAQPVVGGLDTDATGRLYL